jgi:hypothetical protein
MVGTTTRLEPAQIVVMWQQGRQSAWAGIAYDTGAADPRCPRCIRPSRTPNQPDGCRRARPDLDRFVEGQLIFDRTASTNWSELRRGQRPTIRRICFRGPSNRLSLARPNPSVLMVTGSETQTKLEISCARPESSGLLGFRTSRRRAIRADACPGPSPDPRRILRFDPGRTIS